MIYKDNANNSVGQIYYGNIPIKEVYYKPSSGSSLELVWSSEPFHEEPMPSYMVNDFTHVGKAEEASGHTAWFVGGSVYSTKKQESYVMLGTGNVTLPNIGNMLTQPLNNVAVAFAMDNAFAVGGHTSSAMASDLVRRWSPPSVYYTLSNYLYAAAYIQGISFSNKAVFMGGSHTNGLTVPNHWASFSNVGTRTTGTTGISGRNGYFGKCGTSGQYAVYAGGVTTKGNSMNTVRFWNTSMVAIGSTVSLARSKHNCFGVSLANGKYIAVGGKNTNVFDDCDVISPTLTKLPSIYLDYGTHQHSCSENNGYFIKAGGSTIAGSLGTSVIEIFNSTTLMKEKPHFMSNTSFYPAVVTVGKYTYIMGGNNNKMLVRNI